MNGPRDCHAEGSKSEGEVSYDIPYMQNLKKWYKWTYLQNRNRLTYRKQTCGYPRGKGGG